MAQPEKKTTGEKLQSVNKSTLYAVLFIVTSIPFWLNLAGMPGIKIPNQPEVSTVDLFRTLMSLKEGSTILVASDRTNSTRGESGGQFDAIMRILMRRKIKVAIYTTADPQAPQVARDEIAVLNKERTDAGQAPYARWNDYVVLGFFPNAEGTAISIGTNPRKAFAGKKEVAPDGQQTDVYQSPVLKNIQSAGDIPLLLVITASATSTVTIQRLYGKIPLAMAVTGVMGPETHVYYASNQLIGLSKGLKGVYDMETMMEQGLNVPDFEHAPVKSDKYRDESIPGFPGQTNLGYGSKYSPSLHGALLLLIAAVVVGNVGMAMSKRRAK